MPIGKCASQAGHAFLNSYRQASPERQAAYLPAKDDIGTKVCLSVKDLKGLFTWCDWARSNNLPHFLVEDSGRNTTFGGVPTFSALGIGPLNAAEARGLRKLPLLQ
jgi:peptidyl-tRNA hydrolase